MSFQDSRKASPRPSSHETRSLILAVIIIALVLAGMAKADSYLASNLPGGGEFYLLRYAGRSFLFDQIEPYSVTVSSLVQKQVYGQSALAGEDHYILNVPFHLLMVYLPLALLPNVLIARAVWMALTEIALIGFIFLGFRLLDRRIPLFWGGLIFVASFTSYYAYISFVEGSPSILLGLMYIGVLLSFLNGLDELAGALVVLSAFQWEMGGPFLLFIVLVVFWERRWRVFAGAGMLAFLLLVISFIWYPGWLLPFLRASWGNLKLGFGFSAHEMLLRFWPGFGDVLGWLLTAILVLALGYEWGAVRKAAPSRLVWAACLTLAATPLLGFRVKLDQLVVLTLPLILVVVNARERWRKIGGGLAFVLLLFFFGLPWLFYLQGIPPQIGLSEDEFTFLFWPVFSIIGLYWMRWWMIRPPRTWLDIATQPRK